MTMTTIPTGARRVATYERVSSDDQRERETIKTQTAALDARLALESNIEFVGRYADDGVSGTRRLSERPGGAELLRDAAARRFDELWVYRTDRLGRNLADMAATGQRLEELGITVVSVVESRLEPFMFDLMAVLAQNETRTFRRRSADGMDRAAREGRYTGGIVPFGYRVEGVKPKARLVPDEVPLWAGLSAAEVVRGMYRRIALDDWSCRQVAYELNELGVPPHYARDGRGIRGHRTRGVWRPGRIRNMVVETTYRGELRYGRRTKRQRDVVSASITPLVDEGLWQAAQDGLARHRICAKNTDTVYLLRSVMRCSVCRLMYVGSTSRGTTWYRCGGQIHERGAIDGRCIGRGIKGDVLEQVVWQDIERFMRDPGDLLDELDSRAEQKAEALRAAVEADSLHRLLGDLAAQRQRIVDMAVRGVLSDDDLVAQRDRIAREHAALETRLAVLSSPTASPQAVDVDLLDRLRANLRTGLSDKQRQQIVRLLVARIDVGTLVTEDGSKDATAAIHYRFPAVVATRTDKGSWQPRVGAGRGSAPTRALAIAPPCRLPVADAAHRGRCGRTPQAHRGTARRDARVCPDVPRTFAFSLGAVRPLQRSRARQRAPSGCVPAGSCRRWSAVYLICPAIPSVSRTSSGRSSADGGVSPWTSAARSANHVLNSSFALIICPNARPGSSPSSVTITRSPVGLGCRKVRSRTPSRRRDSTNSSRRGPFNSWTHLRHSSVFPGRMGNAAAINGMRPPWAR